MYTQRHKVLKLYSINIYILNCNFLRRYLKVISSLKYVTLNKIIILHLKKHFGLSVI